MRRHLLRSGFALAATCLAVLVMSGSALAASIDGGAWRWQNPLPQGSGYSGICGLPTGREATGETGLNGRPLQFAVPISRVSV